MDLVPNGILQLALMTPHEKRLPIGISDFKQLIEGNYTDVDKSLLIQELMSTAGAVVLIVFDDLAKRLTFQCFATFLKKTIKRLAISLNL